MIVSSPNSNPHFIASAVDIVYTTLGSCACANSHRHPAASIPAGQLWIAGYTSRSARVTFQTSYMATLYG
jgi:hypothetical protein